MKDNAKLQKEIERKSCVPILQMLMQPAYLYIYLSINKDIVRDPFLFPSRFKKFGVLLVVYFLVSKI